jgi:7,8-dihydropterin-6-yl-methyl-4-(beta-D-ribofuranosyl)aminobenzene 5'-phosphate synthase
MSKSVTITVLVENTVNERGLLAEHGLAFFIQTESARILFDTGQSDLILQNAQKLEVPLAELDAIVLSHGHYDHTSGLGAVLKLAPQAKVFHHPAALAPKFVQTGIGTSRSIGITPPNLNALRERASRIVETRTRTEVVEGIFVTGQIPRKTAFEDTGGKFFCEEACVQPDPLLDDQALYFETGSGLVVLLGCAHAGVVNTIDYIQQVTGGKPIHAMIGGLHLLSAQPERLQQTLDAFKRWNPQYIAPGHCTGMAAAAQLWSAFPGRCSSCSVGTKVTFQL